jgi:hypothetical protein
MGLYGQILYRASNEFYIKMEVFVMESTGFEEKNVNTNVNDKKNEENPGKKTNRKNTKKNISRYNYNVDLSKRGIGLHEDALADKAIEPFIISVLPKLFQRNYKRLFSNTFPHYQGNANGAVTLNGSIYPDNIFYNYIENIHSVEELPDILITNDFNGLYHKRFVENFLTDENFEAPGSLVPFINSGLNTVPCSHLLKILAYDVLVMVIRKSDFLKISSPREWYELLNPKLNRKLVLPGTQDFFCNTFYFHFVKNFGYKAIQQISDNILDRIHPEKMVKVINSGNDTETSVFVMPYSYALKLRNILDYETIIPVNDAIIIPVQMLQKRGACEKHREIINFLLSDELGKEFERQGFFSTNICKKNRRNKISLNWIGWDFFEKNDIKIINEKINSIISL